MSRLETLKAAFAAKATGGGNDDWKKFFPFWKMTEGSTIIVRFLPDLDQDNPMGFLVENMVHELTVNGERRTVPCLKMYDEDCPICNLSRKFYDEKNEDLGKKYYRKLSYLGQVVVLESPIEHDQAQLVKLIDFGPKIFKLIQAAFQSGDLEKDPDSLKGGYNFRIKKTKAGQYADYGTSSFAPKQTDLDDDLINRLELMDLKDYRRKHVSRAEIETMLDADLNGTTVPTSKPAATPAATSTPAKTQATQIAEDHNEAAPIASASDATPSPSEESSGGSVLEKLRARAKAKAQTE